jgi:hypothetical protein
VKSGEERSTETVSTQRGQSAPRDAFLKPCEAAGRVFCEGLSRLGGLFPIAGGVEYSAREKVVRCPSNIRCGL